MIALLCMLIVFGLSHGDNLPTRIEVEKSINRTIDEVERLIRENSTLPQLTRREIVDILSNITTSKTIETYENKEALEKARKIYERALMVVLPYNANDAKENIKDLYTKPPIVHIITDSDSKDLNVLKSENLQSSTPMQEIQLDKEPFENLVVTHASEKIIYSQNWSIRITKDTYSEAHTHTHTKMPLTETLKIESTPMKFSFNLDDLQTQPEITETFVISTRRPVFQEESLSTKNKDVYVVYSTSATTMRPIGTSHEEKNVLTMNLEDLSTTPRPSKYNGNVLSVDQWRYNAPTSTAQSLTTSLSTKTLNSSFKISSKDIVVPTVINKIKDTLNISKISFEKIQADVKKQSPIYVTPATSSISFSEKLNSTSNLNSEGKNRKKNITTTMRPEVMELLASIGLRPENSTNVEEVFKNQEDLKSNSEIFDSNGLAPMIFGLTAFAPDSSSIIAQNTFENPVLELKNGMNNLTPDVQLLFQRFGLQTSNLVTSTTSTPRPTVNVNSYTNFKPLPTSRIKNEDMKEFLAKFGLGIGDNRQKKAISVSTERPSLIEVVPDNMRQILENIGLISPKIYSKTTPPTKMKDIEPKNTTKLHIFKPHEVQVKDEKQRMKINELLDIVNKLIQEGKTNAEDVHKIANNLLTNTKTLKDGPDPLQIDEIIKSYNEDIKNEVKRQNPEETVNTTTIGNEDLANTTTTTTESIDVSSTTTTMPITSDSAKNGSVPLDAPDTTPSTSTSVNLMALEESFGGTTSAPDPVLPTRRRSGLYFLLDWNTFLEVGDDDSEKVNLRFQPKVGDRSRFLPVRIP